MSVAVAVTAEVVCVQKKRLDALRSASYYTSSSSGEIVHERRHCRSMQVIASPRQFAGLLYWGPKAGHSYSRGYYGGTTYPDRRPYSARASLVPARMRACPGRGIRRSGRHLHGHSRHSLPPARASRPSSWVRLRPEVLNVYWC